MHVSRQGGSVIYSTDPENGIRYKENFYLGNPWELKKFCLFQITKKMGSFPAEKTKSDLYKKSLLRV